MNIRNIISLSDNNKYLIVGKVDYENKNHYYLVDINNQENIKFCYEDNGDLVEIESPEIIQKLIPIFGEQAMKEIQRLVEINNN